MNSDIVLTRGVRFVQNESGWYMIEWNPDWYAPPLTEAELARAVTTLTAHIEAHDPPPATGPAQGVEDHFETAQEALEHLQWMKKGE